MTQVWGIVLCWVLFFAVLASRAVILTETIHFRI